MIRIEQDPQPNRSKAKSSTVAALLRACRMRSGQNLQDIAHMLCIRYPYLRAIEDGHFYALPGAPYASGFIRAYAEHLGLDGDDVVRRFKAETEDLEQNTSLAFSLLVAEERVPTMGVVLGGGVLAAVAYGIWLWLSSGETVTKLIPPVPERLASLVQNHAVTPQREKTVSIDETKAETARPAAVTGPAIPVAHDAVAMFAPAVVERRICGEQSNSSRVRLYANDDSWVQVNDGKDILLRRSLHKGEKYHVPNCPGLLLMVGDAGAVSAWVDGVIGPPLGPRGKVRRNVSLDPDKLKVASDKWKQAPQEGRAVDRE